jgi:hypothetical protein
MPRKGYSSVRSTVPEGIARKLNAVLNKTGESTSKFLQRIVDYEYKLHIEGDNNLNDKVDEISEKLSSIDDLSAALDKVRSGINRTLLISMICSKDIIKSYNLIPSLIVGDSKLSAKEIEEKLKKSQGDSDKDFSEILNALRNSKETDVIKAIRKR